MRHGIRLIAPLLLIAAACSSEGSSPGSADVSQLKANAQAELERHRVQSVSSGGTSASEPTTPIAVDPCASHGWYADGSCDPWCPQGDADDCGEPMVCPLYALESDGVCELLGPCSKLNDPDCARPVTPPVDGGCATPPPAVGDGKCDPLSYAELVADPDCQSLACPALAGVPDGKCVARSACDYLIDPDCHPIAVPPVEPDGGVACDAVLYPKNGKCEAAPGCENSDPDCGGVGCPDILYPKDGKCQAPAGCASSDADCAVVCIAIAYPADGRCEAAPGCEANDPDCK